VTRGARALAERTKLSTMRRTPAGAAAPDGAVSEG